MLARHSLQHPVIHKEVLEDKSVVAEVFVLWYFILVEIFRSLDRNRYCLLCSFLRRIDCSDARWDLIMNNNLRD